MYLLGYCCMLHDATVAHSVRERTRRLQLGSCQPTLAPVRITRASHGHCNVLLYLRRLVTRSTYIIYYIHYVVCVCVCAYYNQRKNIRKYNTHASTHSLFSVRSLSNTCTVYRYRYTVCKQVYTGRRGL